MRFQLLSIHEASHKIKAPFEPLRLTDLDEYSCFLYRCEGQMALHRHLEHDEVFWPLDHPIELVDEQGQSALPAGMLARVRRGWRHGSAAQAPAHVLLLSRGERVLTMNGHYTSLDSAPPEVVAPLVRLAEVADNTPTPLLRCDSLCLYAERISGTGTTREADHDVLIAPFQGRLGLRCGGLVIVVGEWEIARIPAGTGWHLFGDGSVVWMTKERYESKP
ncbi:MAG: hypothetical protein H0T73_02945 [Ardenticatenales bacterium]|nr:hypothetical protein [Ardenticatenales bacterium]